LGSSLLISLPEQRIPFNELRIQLLHSVASGLLQSFSDSVGFAGTLGASSSFRLSGSVCFSSVEDCGGGGEVANFLVACGLRNRRWRCDGRRRNERDNKRLGRRSLGDNFGGSRHSLRDGDNFGGSRHSLRDGDNRRRRGDTFAAEKLGSKPANLLALAVDKREPAPTTLRALAIHETSSTATNLGCSRGSCGCSRRGLNLLAVAVDK